MKKLFLLLFSIILLSFLVLAEPPIYEKDEIVNKDFQCFEPNGDYCTISTVLIINIESPNGTSVVRNQTLDYQGSFFNFTLPTNDVGEYKSLIHSPTSNNTISEFPYIVTITGKENSNSYIFVNGFLFLFLIILMIGVLVLHRKIDFEKWHKNILRKYEGKNPIKIMVAGLGLTLMKDTFVLYYLIGWPLLIVLEDLVRTFNVLSIQTLLVNMIDLYTIGIFIVGFLFVGSAWQFLKELVDDFDNMKWGVEK